jgi:hypothetical protein
MEKDLDLIVSFPPSDNSEEFLNYCKKMGYDSHDVNSYASFIDNLLQDYLKFMKENGLCCFICHEDLCKEYSLVYSHILTGLTKNNSWYFLDEIILEYKGNNYGKIGVLQNGDTLEVMSRGERLFHVSIPQEEKDEMFQSVWSLPTKKNNIDSKIIKWLVLSYSNAGDRVLFSGRSSIDSNVISDLKRNLIKN